MIMFNWRYIFLFVLVSACSLEESGIGSGQPVERLEFESSGDDIFDTWRKDFALRALQAGNSAESIHGLLSGLELDAAVLRADIEQPEFTRPLWEYVGIATTTARIESGRLGLQKHAAFLSGIVDSYGVAPEILVAIWGMESNYGEYLGKHDAVQVLASMASHGRRKSFGELQLLALLGLLDRGDVSRDQLRRSSWAGALGQTQFMPETFANYGLDWDRDGDRDLWGSESDALGSAANYLSASGWVSGAPWLAEVSLAEGFDYLLALDGEERQLEFWRGLGVELIWPGFKELSEELSGELFLPAGLEGPAFLLFKNFRILKAYNHSDAYALSVSLLAHELAGRGGIRVSWPEGKDWLSVMEVKRLQELLEVLGYGPLAIDGVAGRRTRLSLGRFQKDRGIISDGFPTRRVLYELSAAAGLSERDFSGER